MSPIAQATPPRTFTIYEEDDGWETIQEAQNAVATFVLYNVSFLPCSFSCCLTQSMPAILSCRYTEMRPLPLCIWASG